jgi:hypothetical protein
MKEGIRRLYSEDHADAALLYFDRALELRRRLPAGVDTHAYGLAACWLNRAEALTSLRPAQHALALRAYDEALALLRLLPPGDPRFDKRLAIAHQNRALALMEQNPPARTHAVAALADAIAVLERSDGMDAPERDYLLAVVWMNLANIQALEDTTEPDPAAQEAALRALALLQTQEQKEAAAAEASLVTRHILCRLAARRLAESQTVTADVHEATDLADEGLALVREWERRGVHRFRNLAADLLRFGGRVYARYQPQFLSEFLKEQLDPQESAQSYVRSREMRKAAREMVLLLAAASADHE